MGQTAHGFPYPEPTDPVAQGADAIKALASAVDTRSGVSASARVDVPLVNSASANLLVTFPAGRFSTVPAIACSATWTTYMASPGAPTATGFTMNVRRIDNVVQNITVTCYYVAHLPG